MQDDVKISKLSGKKKKSNDMKLYMIAGRDGSRRQTYNRAIHLLSGNSMNILFLVRYFYRDSAADSFIDNRKKSNENAFVC